MTLHEILKYKRPHDSGSEQMFLSALDSVLGRNGQIDTFGNRYLTIGDNPATMFSCHVDTVHRTEGYQPIQIDTNVSMIFSGTDECLGADDAAGIYAMLKMIKADINGLYVFHRAEEIGGQGSDHFALNYSELLKDINHCVAFDRRGSNSVITHQAGDTCCSGAFASALSKQLGMGFKPDSTGVFTDSANYTHLIPECTNLSVGYDFEHTKNEYLDYLFLGRLTHKLIEVDWNSLPVVREPVDFGYGYNFYQDDYYRMPNYFKTFDEAYEYVINNPDEAAEWLYDYHYNSNN